MGKFDKSFVRVGQKRVDDSIYSNINNEKQKNSNFTIVVKCRQNFMLNNT